MKKRLIAFVLVLVFAIGLVPSVFAAGASFSDVAPGAWYEEAVVWAVENNITTGMGDGKFAPNNTCTRAQVVTFLWRSQGEPAPAGSANPFTDVKETDYFYDAVLWAVENGITTGLSATSFGPSSPCNRAQVVTFLWRTMGKPAPQDPTNPFTDVAEGIYYYDAVLWAVENGITTGMGEGVFAPDKACNRGQIVCFLFRTPAQGGVTRVELNSTELNLNYGGGYQLAATVSPEDAEDKTITWSSSNESIATVSADGYVRAGTAEGSAVITAKAVNGRSASCTVFVKDETGVTSIGFPVDTLWLAPGESCEQVAQFNEGAIDKTVTWSSSDESVATVEDKGLMEGGRLCTITAGSKDGDVVITATAANGLSAECYVRVRSNVILYKPDGMVMEVAMGDRFDYLGDGWAMENYGLSVEKEGNNNGIQWKYGDGYLYVGGSGEISYYNAPWASYKSEVSSVYLQRGVVEVSSFLFDSYSSLSHVELSDTVTTLDSYSFDGCSLKRIGIPASVTSIHITAFDSHKKPASSSNGDMVVYCEPGSYAESWAIQNGLEYVEASMVYAADGRTIMVSDSEKALYLQGGWYATPVVTVYAMDGTEKNIAENELDEYLANGWYADKSEIMTTVYAPDGSTKEVLKIDADKLESEGWYAYPVSYVYSADGAVKVVATDEVDEYVKNGWYKDKSELYVTMYDIDGNTKDVLKADVAKEQANGWYLYEDYKRAQVEKYSYLAGNDFRSVRRDYPHAVAKGGYVVTFTDANGDFCALTYVVYEIMSDYSVTTLHNITQGKTIKNPVDYYEKQADRAWGNSKIKYMQMANDVREMQVVAIKGLADAMKSGVNTGSGAYVTAYTLNL